MLRLLPVVFVTFLTAIPVALSAETPIARALDAVRARDWPAAAEEVKGAGPVARDIVEWHRLRTGQGRPKEVLAFLARRPSWPGLPYLREKSEDAFASASTNDLAALFAYGPAQTAEGVLLQARFLERQNREDEAKALVIKAWTSMAVGPGAHDAFLDRYGRLLRAHHEDRMDFVLWQGWENNTSRMMPLVNDGWKRLAKARLGLRQQVNGVDDLIAAVPANLRDHPGLNYERFLWRARKNRDASAIELLLSESEAGKLGRAEEWAGRRRGLAREKMRDGAYGTAYRIAATHGLSPDVGYAYSDCEWIAGYIALRFLNKPGIAAQHFVRFKQSVETPISLGRAGYWLGRAYEAMGDAEAAQRAYREGGEHQTSFYGLLAAEKAGMPPSSDLRGDEVFPDWKTAAFTQSSVHEAARLLLEGGELALAERFWLHLSETQDRETLGQMGTMAQELGAPHVAVMLGKKMAQRGIVLPGPYYALHPLVNARLPVPPEMALAIARRESEFDPSVVSGAGARGLMQVMPGTARQVAAAIGQPYSHAWLTSNPEYNVTLGTSYLAGLAREFDGNVILISAGYNAGPSRPERWMRERGDPRRRGVDIIDWIEHIPFSETRNYVMRVAESLPVYRARLGRNPHPVPFSQELVGSTIRATR
ncbi:lytic transglycosylase domain-containing protein [Shimia sp. FJ5]|uniref:lytic transglycosylase domain-containing protein n=1 Tax=Shimia sp. FJ5 TaxID=3079054 RepID=UPI002614B3AC|nr:lytic transglycosylase domain-containing protein [Shimia sp. FJ5]MDV4144513.1 lytic transglycosylase domain-containing protein [Shimia sp. FJ5]